MKKINMFAPKFEKFKPTIWQKLRKLFTGSYWPKWKKIKMPIVKSEYPKIDIDNLINIQQMKNYEKIEA